MMHEAEFMRTMYPRCTCVPLWAVSNQVPMYRGRGMAAKWQHRRSPGWARRPCPGIQRVHVPCYGHLHAPDTHKLTSELIAKGVADLNAIDAEVAAGDRLMVKGVARIAALPRGPGTFQ